MRLQQVWLIKRSMHADGFTWHGKYEEDFFDHRSGLSFVHFELLQK
jgi:hypothetical protein